MRRSILREWLAVCAAVATGCGDEEPKSGLPAATAKITLAERQAQRGLQTKQLAAALFVSPKGHLTRIYGKLDVRSRTELAHRLGENVRMPAAPPPPAGAPPVPA